MFQEIRNSATGALDRAKLVVNKARGSSSGSGTEMGDEEASQQSSNSAGDQLEALAEYCPQLTFQQRLIGFAVCFSIGYMIAFFSFRFFIHLVEGHPIPFALNYTFGHILQLLASTFLCGPKRQFKNMFDEKRRITSIVYLSCLASNLLIIFLPLPGPLKLILLLIGMMVQLAASVWYTLSYIPYGRRTALKCIKRNLGLDESAGTADYSNIVGGGGAMT